MRRCSQTFWTRELARWLLPVAVFGVLLGWRVEAGASSVSVVSSFDAVEHSHHCKCGTRCRGASCCCGPRRAEVRKPRPSPATVPAWSDANPCLKAAPCGDSGLPSAPSTNHVCKADALAIAGRARRNAEGRLMASSPCCALPPERASRLDDPPECPPFA
jgi:hypothetical protein